VTGLEAVFVITAYSFGCGATGLTQYAQRDPVPFYTAAVDRHVIKGGSLLELAAPFVRGRLWYAEDTGRDIKGNRIDIMVKDCDQARWWGRRSVRVRVVGHHPRELLPEWWQRGLAK
jgi:3D (Asp-Asp-Asp) domain-containing protein